MTTEAFSNGTPASTTPAVTTATHRDRQRVALRDLVALATECAATEAQIEQRHQKAMEAAAKDLDRNLFTTEDRYKTLCEQTNQEQQQRHSQIEAQFQAEQKKLSAADRTAKQRIEHEYNSAQRDIKEKYDQATWLAESLYDGTAGSIREEVKAARKRFDEQSQALNGLSIEAEQLLALYKLAPMAIPDAPELTVGDDAETVHKAKREQAEGHLRTLGRLQIPHLFVGARPVVLATSLVLLTILAVFAIHWARTNVVEPNWVWLAYSVPGIIVVTVGAGFLLSIAGKRQVRDQYTPLRHALVHAQQAAEQQLANFIKLKDEARNVAAEQRKAEEQIAKDRFSPLMTQAAKKRDAMQQAAQADHDRAFPILQQQKEQAIQQTQESLRRKLDELRRRYEADQVTIRERHQRAVATAVQMHADGRETLEKRLQGGLASIQAPIGETDRTHGQSFMAWEDPAWNTWTPPKKFASMVRFGRLRVDLNQIADSVPSHGERTLALPEAFDMPASLGFPRQASLLIQTDREGREDALCTIQMLMARLLTVLPAGRVKFTIIDPVGLGQNFAGFMHLADHDDSLVGGRIWTDPEQIEQRLVDLTEHMETVIQKYLRNEYETIDDYNAQAGELAEPYRFLVIADLPTGFEGESFRRLASIANSGARCGVYTLIMQDTRQALPSDAHLEDLMAHSVTLERQEGLFVWKDDVFSQFPLTLDPPPGDEFLTRILDVVGRHAKEAKRVELDFDTIAPTEQQFWTGDSSGELRTPVGRMGATRLQFLRLGKGVAQHVLTAGKTGSGKSTLLHALITNLAMWYRPDQVEFYLVDFKKGVEFKTYATHSLPHARAIAVESDREFGLSVLQRIDAELSRRGTLFRKLGVQDLASYRQASGLKIPRTLLIIDEFQEFFSEDDKLSQDAALLLDRLVRQGRAFGIHVLLGSQTIGGTSGLARSTIGQMAVRIALQCSEADSQMILGDNNSAARLLTRPGEAIYNDAGGLVEANSPFQVAWLPDERRDVYLKRIQQHIAAEGVAYEPAVVFEGNAPADLSKNQRLTQLLESSSAGGADGAPQAWIGDPVAIKEATAITFRRQSGSNAIVIGQQEESALAIMAASILSLAAQHPAGGASFYVMDGSPADSPLAGVFPHLKGIIPHEMKLIEWRAVPEAMAKLQAEMGSRQAEEKAGAPSVYVIIYGLQRYRVLRRQEDTFSFGGDDDGEKKPQADKIFADLLREGPALGIHVIIWADTPVSIERTFDRGMLREFDNRILFQMSANDSSNLIDSPMANKLGFYRALAYSEEQGVMEKFRPYALPTKAWMEHVKQRLAAKGAPAKPIA